MDGIVHLNLLGLGTRKVTADLSHNLWESKEQWSILPSSFSVEVHILWLSCALPHPHLPQSAACHHKPSKAPTTVTLVHDNQLHLNYSGNSVLAWRIFEQSRRYLSTLSEARNQERGLEMSKEFVSIKVLYYQTAQSFQPLFISLFELSQRWHQRRPQKSVLSTKNSNSIKQHWQHQRHQRWSP